MKTNPLLKHLKTKKWYNDLYSKIVKDEADWWRDDLSHLSYNPKPEHLKKLRELLIKKKPDITDQEVWESSQSLLMFTSLAMSHAVIKLKEKKRRKTIKEWRDRDRAKDERILNTPPFTEIKCSQCGSMMEYKFSELYDKGTLKEPNEQVMFFYECPNKCKRKFIFEDGTPWVSKENNKCPVCNGDRNTTVTKDNQDKIFFIHICIKCGSKQVQTEDEY